MKLKIRQAGLDDIPQMVEIDHKAWWSEVAFTAGQFRSQIERYPAGVLVAEIVENEHSRLVGTICGLRVNSSFADRVHTWHEATGDGYFTTHDPNGNVAFGANLSVLPEFERKGIGDKLFGYAAEVLVRDDMRYLVLGGRLPGLAEHNKRLANHGLPPVTGEEYADLKDEQGRVLDDELRFYLKQPFLEMIRVLPEYFPDPDSENYGVLLKWSNPLYALHLGWIYKVPLLGSLIAHQAARLVRLLV